MHSTHMHTHTYTYTNTHKHAHTHTQTCTHTHVLRRNEKMVISGLNSQLSHIFPSQEIIMWLWD